MPTDPSDPKSPNLYQTTSTASKGGGGGTIFFVILLVLVLGGGAAYYFKVSKPAVATIVAQTPTPTPVPTPKPTPKPPEGYTREQRQQYITTAVNSFKALRQSKAQPFTDAFAALTAAGGLGSTGLTSKDAIAARRDLIQKCLAANDDYSAFIKGQEAAYTAELKKTPLTPNDVEVESSYAGAKMPTDKIVQLRTLQGEALKTGDQMLAYLDSKFGAWTFNAEKHAVLFKKPADSTPFTTLAKTYGEQVASLNKLRDEVNAVSKDDPTAASPAATGAATTPAAAAAPSATP